jgi:hypothetical protein
MLRKIVVGLVVVLAACERKPQAVHPATAPDQSYTIRAQVTALPDPPKQALRLHHEAIPTFVGSSGKVEGMEEMEMEFPFLAPSASLKGIAPNDLVEATMEIRWKAEPRFVLTSIRKLPPGTVLNISPEGKPEQAPGGR